MFCSNLVGALEPINITPGPAAPRLWLAEVVPVVRRCGRALINGPTSIHSIRPVLFAAFGRGVRTIFQFHDRVGFPRGWLAVLPRRTPVCALACVLGSAR